ncbi:cytochrome c1 heme lyase [Maudiozyma humilis]|uniref:Holocytochrome c-type synthase n=1 Tax=Maudiozyma humilis TaxID=51915 RepID=A0AAV5RUR0_MAUHU|nr:cytochrome c1 heme lyase [Kazachstania humilis]
MSHTSDDTSTATAAATPPGDISQCPVDEATRLAWLETHRPGGSAGDITGGASDITPDAGTGADPSALSSARAVSSIPRTAAGGNWVYPSEQQFYDAMQRKGMAGAGERMDMRAVIPIHNDVNERVWRSIERWEGAETSVPAKEGTATETRAAPSLSLTSFQGDSKKVTPRAWIRHYLLRMDLPFDRHDWVVERRAAAGAVPRRIDYVIDFYMDKTRGVYLDVRPKLNTLEGCKRRLLHFLGL